MNSNHFKKVLEEISPFTDYIYLHVKGEPLLHPELEEILFQCQEYNLKVNITTNGTLLWEKKSILQRYSNLRQLNISLHSFESQDSIKHQVYLDQIIQTAKEFRDNTNTIIALRLWNLDKTSPNHYLHEKNQLTLHQLEQGFSLEYSIANKLSQLTNGEKGILLSTRIYLNQDYEFIWPSLDAPFVGDTGFCYGIKNQLAILSDGTVTPCCLDDEGTVALGNIFTTPLSDILSSDRAIKIEKGFSCRRVIEPLCKHCSYRTRFGS